MSKKQGKKRLVKLSEQHKRFADYWIETTDGTESAIRAGFSAKSARFRASVLLDDPLIQDYIAERMASKENDRIASQDEVLQFLTGVMRGDVTEQIPLLDGDGYQKLATLDAAQPKDRIRAAELLGKRYAMWTDKKDIDSDVSISIAVDYGDGGE